MTYKMFISYATEDKKFVDQIELLLAREFSKHIEPVISAHRRRIGEDVGRKVLGHIDECDWFLVLLTKKSVRNPTVTNELGYATYAYKAGRIKRIIPVVERVRKRTGKQAPIDTGIFVTPFVESAPYFSEEEHWQDSINDIERYLRRVVEEESKPTAELLESRSESLSQSGYAWEAAETLRSAADEYTKSGRRSEAIDAHQKAADLYRKANYVWEAAQSHVTIAKLLEKEDKVEAAAGEYEERARLLADEVEYGWEMANSYERAGDGYRDVGNSRKARSCYEKAIAVFKQGNNEPEARRVAKKLKNV